MQSWAKLLTEINSSFISPELPISVPVCLGPYTSQPPGPLSCPTEKTWLGLLRPSLRNRATSFWKLPCCKILSHWLGVAWSLSSRSRVSTSRPWNVFYDHCSGEPISSFAVAIKAPGKAVGRLWFNTCGSFRTPRRITPHGKSFPITIRRLCPLDCRPN